MLYETNQNNSPSPAKSTDKTEEFTTGEGDEAEPRISNVPPGKVFKHKLYEALKTLALHNESGKYVFTALDEQPS